jgi:hypothetical protein
MGVEDVLILVAVVALPWFWGGVEMDAYRTAAAVVAVAAGWSLARSGAMGLGLGRRALWLLPAFLLGAWAFAQSVPMPRAWVDAVSPKAAALQAEAFGPEGQDAVRWLRGIEADARAKVPEAPAAVANAAGPFAAWVEVPAPPRRFTLSISPSATLEDAFWYAALLLAFLLVHRRTAEPRRAERYRRWLFGLAVALAVVGVMNRLTAPTRVLWLREVSPGVRPFGPYADPSHFAGVMELVGPWLLGAGLQGLVQSGDSERTRTFRKLALAGSALCAAAAILAASKMAAAMLGVTYAILIAFAIVRGRGRARGVLLAGAAAGALVCCGLAAYGPLRVRIGDFMATHSGGLSQSLRGIAWTAGLRMARDYPLTGTGFGAFDEAFPAYVPRGESGVWNALHNDYLELYVSGGMVAVTFFAWLAAAYAWRVVRVARAKAVNGRLLPTLGLVLGLAAIAAHEIVDFNLQVPANALLFVVMAAICVSPLMRPAEDA